MSARRIGSTMCAQVSNLEIIQRLYSRPTPQQALLEAMKEYLRLEDTEATLTGLAKVAQLQHETEEKQRRGEAP